MLKNLRYKIIFLVISVMIGAGVFAQQNFKYVVELGEVGHPGFYRIDLLPDVVSYLQPQLQDIRILDGRGKQVPYVVQIENQLQGNSRLTLLPLPSISQQDSSDGFSYIHLRFQREYQISKLSLQVRGAKFFQRNLHILNVKAPYEILTYRLSSNDSAVYQVDFKTNRLLIKIQNDDNPPLQLTRAEAYQVHHSLVAWLEKGAGYRIVFGDSQAVAPRYDLSFFKDSIHSIPIVLQQGKIEEIAGTSRDEDEDLSERKVWLWIALAFVLSILLFFSFRMTRELNKKAR